MPARYQLQPQVHRDEVMGLLKVGAVGARAVGVVGEGLLDCDGALLEVERRHLVAEVDQHGGRGSRRHRNPDRRGLDDVSATGSLQVGDQPPCRGRQSGVENGRLEPALPLARITSGAVGGQGLVGAEESRPARIRLAPAAVVRDPERLKVRTCAVGPAGENTVAADPAPGGRCAAGRIQGQCSLPGRHPAQRESPGGVLRGEVEEVRVSVLAVTTEQPVPVVGVDQRERHRAFRTGTRLQLGAQPHGMGAVPVPVAARQTAAVLGEPHRVQLVVGQTQDEGRRLGPPGRDDGVLHPEPGRQVQRGECAPAVVRSVRVVPADGEPYGSLMVEQREEVHEMPLGLAHVRDCADDLPDLRRSIRGDALPQALLARLRSVGVPL